MSPQTMQNGQRGIANLKAIIWTVILFSFVYVCVLVVPLYVNDYEFRDTIATAAQFASVGHEPPEDIRAKLFKEAQKADVPVALQDIKVAEHNGRIDISADYSVTVDLHVYQWKLNFHPSASSNRL